jgi:hypothetical protein
MKLVFERPNSIFDRLRTYVIIVDGVESGRIQTGRTLTLDVSQEEHEVRLKIDWCGSNAVRVPKDIVEIRFCCRNTFAGWKALIPLYIPFIPWYYITFGRHNYLTLEAGKPITRR